MQSELRPSKNNSPMLVDALFQCTCLRHFCCSLLCSAHFFSVLCSVVGVAAVAVKWQHPSQGWLGTAARGLRPPADVQSFRGRVEVDDEHAVPLTSAFVDVEDVALWYDTAAAAAAVAAAAA